MARRKAAPKREILPDPLFKSKLLAKFINTVMRAGKKSVAEKAVYGALDLVVKKLKDSGKLSAIHNHDDEGGEGSVSLKPTGDIRKDNASRTAALNAFKDALDKVTPTVEVKSRRVGGSTYQVPVEIPADRRSSMAMRWIIKHAQEKVGRSMTEGLSAELIDCYQNQGSTIKKKDETHRMAEANRAFAHYKW